MKLCAVKWCAALVVGEGLVCVVHKARGPKFATKRLDEDAPDAAGDCKDCNGTGECETCDGAGEHRCEAWRCDDLHDCGACRGSGKCADCDGTGFTDKQQRFVLNTEEAAYLKWATWAYQVPPPPFTQPWEDLF